MALSYSGIEGNGLQVLLNSLAEYQPTNNSNNEKQNNQLVIRYLPKVEHFLTDSLEVSIKQSIRDYFEDPDLQVILKLKEELIKTPKDRKIARHEKDVEAFCQQLTENLCVAKLQSELGAVIDKQTIKVKSKDF